MSLYGNSPTSLPRDIVRSLWRHRGKSLLVFCVILCAVAVYTAIAPRSYRSEGRLLVRLGRENAVLDPTATSGASQTVSLPISREGEVNSILEMLRSRSLLEEVVDAMGPAKILANAASDPKDADVVNETNTGLVDRLADIGLYHRTSQREKAIRAVQVMLKVQVLSKSNVVSVTFESSQPSLAQAVVQATLDHYVQQHIRSNRIPGAQSFLRNKTNELREALTECEQELENLRNEYNLTAVDERRRIAEQIVRRLEEEAIMTTTQLAATEADVKKRGTLMKTLDSTIVTTTTTGDVEEAVDGMRKQLFDLEAKQQELLSKFAADHPVVIAIALQVHNLRQILNRELERQRSTVTHGRNRTYEEVEIAQLSQQPVIESQRAKLKALQEWFERSRGELAEVNTAHRRISQLEREVALLDASYRRHYEKLEQANTDYELETARMTNISVFQPATLETRPIRPSIVQNLAIGLVLALLGSVGLALYCDAPKPSAARHLAGSSSPKVTDSTTLVANAESVESSIRHRSSR